MPVGEGCQVHAGVIDKEGNLTHKAKKNFIDDVKNEGLFGTDNVPIPQLFPCGVSIKPIPYFDQLDLADEKKFPDFHKNILGSYKKIAIGLNLASDFKILPICCPMALAFKLGIDLKPPKFPDGFIPFLIPNLPLLALKMELFPPPKLVLKFPEIPSIPPPLPSFDIPPNIKFPDFKTFFDLSLAYSIGIPEFMLNLALNMPKLILKLPNIPSLFASICDIAHDAKLFGDIKPQSTMELLATKVLIKKTVECSFFAAVGTTIGSSGGGIVGLLGKANDLDPDYEDSHLAITAASPREKIVQYAKDCIGLSWGRPETRKEYIQRLFYTETATEPPSNDPRIKGYNTVSQTNRQMSTCGVFARACLASGGASYVFEFDYPHKTNRAKNPDIQLWYDFYHDEYRDQTAIDGIIQSAVAKDAVIAETNQTQHDLPALKKGDVIITYNPDKGNSQHVIVLIDDYTPGSFKLETAEGGVTDIDNPKPSKEYYPTAIGRRTYLNRAPTPAEQAKVTNNSIFMYHQITIGQNYNVVLNGKNVQYILDGEKICLSPIGTSMSTPNQRFVGNTPGSDNTRIPPLAT